VKIKHKAVIVMSGEPSTIKHLVYYSLAISPFGSREAQWIQSIRSLRRYNSEIPVQLFLFNGAPPAILREAQRQRVEVFELGDYAQYLAGLFVHGPLLAQYPTFHKFLVLRHSAARSANHILYLDCDTFFFEDVETLFGRYGSFDWCAREEPTSRASHTPSNHFHLDEECFESVTRAAGLHYVYPCNTGFCLMNRYTWERLDNLRTVYLDLAWRLLVARQLAIKQPSGWESEIYAATMPWITDSDRSRALPFPSQNHWIIEEIALWFTLAHIPNLSQVLLHRDDVAQGSECVEALRTGRAFVAAHYFSSLESTFFETVGCIDS
jgi:hypothetical protein